MVGTSRVWWGGAAVLAAAAIVGLVLARPARMPAGAPVISPGIPAATPPGGGDLVATIRSEPRSFNRYTNRDFATELISLLTQARLVRVNKATQEVEPWLADRWTCAPDGLTCTLSLRRGVTFSDGVPFTSADVLFAFEAIYDEATGSPLAESVAVGGKQIQASAPDASTVVIRFPSPFGPGLRILDNLPILPRHALEPALRAGTLRKAWGVDTRPGDIVGLGPFVLRDYRPGERLVFERNPRYWRTDAAGGRLPYLDHLTLDVVPDQNAELLRLESGQADTTQSEVRPDDYAVLKRAADAGRVRLMDAGLAFDSDCLWFNLKPAANGDPGRPWLRSLELRRAVSLAVDRQAFVNTVFLGAAEPIWGPVSPSNRTWFPPPSALAPPVRPYDPEAARALLGRLGLRDTTGDGLLEDANGRPVRFALVTQKGNTALERGAGVIRDDLKRIGVGVDVVALEVGALVDRMLKGDYDAIYYRFLTTDTDPALNLDFWLSSGSAHVWNMEQARPATPWERELDALMIRQAAEPDLATRQRLFWQAQGILAEHLPVLYFAVPQVFVATSVRVRGATPAPGRPPLLWNADLLAVAK